MPLSALRLEVAAGLPSTEIEVDNDSLARFGILRGSTIEYVPFEERYKIRLFHVWIKPLQLKAVVKMCLDCPNPSFVLGGVEYKEPDFTILGAIIVKPKLRLVERS